MQEKTKEREQSLREEVANAITHGFGAALLIAASPFLLVTSLKQGGAWGIVSASIFVATAILLYATSMLYHATPRGRWKRILQVADHSAIFLLIAGTYTPFTLGVLRGPWGWSLFGTIWGLAILGLVAECMGFKQIQAFSTGLYLAMGWLVVVAIVPLVMRIQLNGLVLLVTGGLFYTVGVIFYALERVRYFHAIWHVFVLLGTTLHFFAIMNYAA